MARTTQLGALILLFGCVGSHGASPSSDMVTCEDVKTDPSLEGESCGEDFGACTFACGNNYICSGGRVAFVGGMCPPQNDCANFLARGNQPGDACSFDGSCMIDDCMLLKCDEGIAKVDDTCDVPSVTCDEFLVSNLPLGTACDEEIFGRCGGQDEFCCGAAEHWCEDGKVVAGALDPCVCQPVDDICNDELGRIATPEQCEAQCELGTIPGIPCCTTVRHCDENNQIAAAVTCDDSCAQSCDLIDSERGCIEFGCEWFVSDACTDGLLPPRCVNKRVVECSGPGGECPGGQTCEPFTVNPCKDLPCQACAGEQYWCQ